MILQVGGKGESHRSPVVNWSYTLDVQRAIIFDRMVETSFTTFLIEVYHPSKRRHHFLNGGNDFLGIYSILYINGLQNKMSSPVFFRPTYRVYLHISRSQMTLVWVGISASY